MAHDRLTPKMLATAIRRAPTTEDGTALVFLDDIVKVTGRSAVDAALKICLIFGITDPGDGLPDNPTQNDVIAHISANEATYLRFSRFNQAAVKAITARFSK